MSVLRVPCPHCGTLLNVPTRFAGRAGRCSGCRRPFAVPAPPSRRGWLWLGLGAFALLVGFGIAVGLAVNLPRGQVDPVTPSEKQPVHEMQTFAPPIPTAGGAKRALLIGVNEYGSDSELTDLQYPVRDVEELGNVLRSNGYEVVLLATGREVPTRDAIRRAFASMKAKSTDGDTLVVAFAGHGTQPDGTFYFCPADTRGGDTGTLVSLDEVFAGMRECKGSVKLLLADACRNKSPDLSRGRIVSGLASKSRPRQQLPSPPSNVTAFYSCSEGELAFEHPSLRHGVFFHFVIQGLKGAADFNRSGEVTVPKLQEYVQKEVLSFVRRQIDRQQRPDLETRTNVNAPIVSFGKTAAPAPAPTAASKGFDYEETFAGVAEGALPHGWTGGEFAVARARDGTPYLRLKRTAGRHYVHALSGSDLGEAFALECEFALGPAQALEIAFAAEGTPGVSLLVRGDGTMLFPGARPAQPEAFRRGRRNAIRLWRVGTKFRVSVNDEGEGADCVFDADMPRRLTGVSLGYVAARANELATFNTASSLVAGGVGQTWGPASAWPSRPVEPPAEAADPGIYSLRVGKLPHTPTSAGPSPVRAMKLRHEFSGRADLPAGWQAKDFDVIRDEGGRMALLCTSNRPREFTATLTTEGMKQGLNGDYFLEFEYAAGRDGLTIVVDAIGTELKVPPALGDEASRLQRLFVQRVGSTLTIVYDGKDPDKHVHLRHGPLPPVREVRVTMKGGRDVRTAARLYAVRGGELEPRVGGPEAGAPPAPAPSGLLVDFAKGDADRHDDWEVLKSTVTPTVVEKDGRRWLGLPGKGGALIALPRVDVTGDFTAEVDFTIGREGTFALRFVRAERDPKDDKFFVLAFDGAGNAAIANSQPKAGTGPVMNALRYDRPNTLRIVRTGADLQIDLNGTAHRPIRDYPRVAFTAVQMLLAEPSASPAQPVGVTRVSVMPK